MYSTYGANMAVEHCNGIGCTWRHSCFRGGASRAPPVRWCPSANATCALIASSAMAMSGYRRPMLAHVRIDPIAGGRPIRPLPKLPDLDDRLSLPPGTTPRALISFETNVRRTWRASARAEPRTLCHSRAFFPSQSRRLSDGGPGPPGRQRDEPCEVAPLPRLAPEDFYLRRVADIWVGSELVSSGMERRSCWMASCRPCRHDSAVEASLTPQQA